MNCPDSGAVTTPGKKTRFSPAARALVLGLVLALIGPAAMATNKPIPGIDVVVKKNPGGIAITTQTGADGAYQFKGLAPGSYDLFVAGARLKKISIKSSNQGTLSGVLSKEPGGKASITFNGQVGVVPVGPAGAPAKGEEANSALGTVSTTRGIATPPGGGTPGEQEGVKISENASPRPITRGSAPGPTGGEDKAGISDQAAAGGLTSYGAAPPPPKEEELPGLAGEPIQGTPIGLEGDPGSIKVSTKTDEHGAFHFDKLPAGKYKLTLPGLPSQSLTVGDKGSIGGTLKRNDDGTASITVSDRKPVVLSGQIPSAAGVRVAAGDINGDGVETRKAAPKKAAGKTPHKIVEILGNQSPEEIKVGDPIPEPVGPAGAPVVTSRSNKKAGIAKAEEPPPADAGTDDLPGAPVNTSRSNKKAGIAKAEEPLPDVLPSEANSALSQVSTTRGTAPSPGGGDVKPGISDQAAASNLSSYSTAPPPPKEEGLPGLAGDPIPGIPIGLEGDPGSIKVSTKTDEHGAFHFDKLPAGKYKLTLPGLPSQSLTVGADGIAGGKVMRGPDGSMSIFDRWGKLTAAAPKGGGSKTAEKPVGFGSGNTMGAGPGGMGPGGGMAPPGAGPGMSPMGPGAGPGPMGGAGGGMRP